MNRPVDQEPGHEPEFTATDNWLTIPNLVTIVRFLLVPVFVWQMIHDEYWAALITLVVLFSTDWIDGFLARRLDQVSSVGKWLDPLADRLSLWVVIITVVLSGLAPLWLIFALVIPDLVLAGLMLSVYAGNPQMEVTFLGKARTAALMLGVPLLLFAEAPFVDETLWTSIATGILAIGAGGHLVAGVDYAVQGIRYAIKMRKLGLDPKDKGHRDEFFEMN
ncbi:CDP-alcohol phosphatidyltransferase family protein [Yaniella halotolerans]|uniref:CDP-alcohol phosphatidyltransferase family protein n=1 Tax=Yaniella halotolerans TaxID=225453 RepID=UPI0003B34E86|nr:CDP-alcohol phosphatidyltransferase family protein [Yaniella halotolerans]